MSKKSKKPPSISTKTGDQGTTGLANGERVSKASPIFSAIGTLDELNSWLGLVAAKFAKLDDTKLAKQKTFLYEVQDTLFYIGAELARSPKTNFKEASLTKLEKHAAALQESMAEDWHTKFLLPGGTELGGYLDVARSVSRRLEREVVALSQTQDLRPVVLKYVNRLSDYMYILRCFVNHQLHYKEQQFLVKD